MAVRREAGLTLLFPVSGAASDAGQTVGRPDADAIGAAAARSGPVVPFAVSHRPTDHPYWVELLALGLTFDLRGLSPGIGAQVAQPGHAFGLPLADAAGLDALVLRPGPHLASAGALMPVVRTMAALGCELAALPGLAAIGWEPSGTVMSPDYFRRTVGAWLDGGAFPALGFTALSRSPQGAMRSVGLNFFLGHELELAPRAGESAADAARAAVRLIHDLVENGTYTPGEHRNSQGDVLHCRFNADLTLLQIRRD